MFVVEYCYYDDYFILGIYSHEFMAKRRLEKVSEENRRHCYITFYKINKDIEEDL